VAQSDNKTIAEGFNGSLPATGNQANGQFTQAINAHGGDFSNHSATVSEQSQDGYHQPSNPDDYSMVNPQQKQFNTLPSIAEHLLHLATTKDGVDWGMQVNSPSPMGQPFMTYAHSIILFRSFRLQRLMTRQHANSYGTNIVTLYPPRNVLPHAFEAALRFLYSDTVISKDFFLQQPGTTDIRVHRLHNLEYILSYWISGIELGLEPISARSGKLLSDYLDWDILEVAYKAATEIMSSPLSSAGKHMVGSDYLVAGSSIIQRILQFLASHIDLTNFKLDAGPAPSVVFPRLPQVDGGRPRTNPALASMVFGSMPTSAEIVPSSPESDVQPVAHTFQDTVSSNILLNLDFDDLARFTAFLQARDIAGSTRIMHDIVEEREARRQKVLNTPSVSNKVRMANSAIWDVVGLREGFANNALTRERVGFLLPTK
jgi:hypothetical protein